MKLTENLSPECIKLPLSSHDRCGAIDELVDRLALCQRIQDAGLMRQEMAARKSFCANNVGSLAILSHVQSSTCTQQALAVGRTGLPMARRPYDDRPVDLYFLLVTPLTEPHRHVEAMARISGWLKNPQLAAAIHKAPDPQAMVDLLTLVDLTDDLTWTRLVA